MRGLKAFALPRSGSIWRPWRRPFSASWRLMRRWTCPASRPRRRPTRWRPLAQPRRARLLAGSTDVGLWVNKQFRELGPLIYTGRVAELRALKRSKGRL